MYISREPESYLQRGCGSQRTQRVNKLARCVDRATANYDVATELAAQQVRHANFRSAYATNDEHNQSRGLSRASTSANGAYAAASCCGICVVAAGGTTRRRRALRTQALALRR